MSRDSPFLGAEKLVPKSGWAKLEQLGHRRCEGWYLDEGSRILVCRPPLKAAEWNGVYVSAGPGAVVVGVGGLYQLSPSEPPENLEAFVLESLADILWAEVRKLAPPPLLQEGDWVRFRLYEQTEVAGTVVRLEEGRGFEEPPHPRAVVRLDQPREDVFGGKSSEDDCEQPDQVREVRRGGSVVWPPPGLEVSVNPPVLGP